ncbi:hypothetical protein ACHAXS_001717 [Conticribra weissflogii]
MGSNVSKSNNQKKVCDDVINRCESTTGKVMSIKSTRPQDAFLLYSNKDNLRKVRNFEDIKCDNGCSDQRDGSISRKKRISYEKDAVTFILENVLLDEHDFDTDGETNGVDDEIDFTRLLDLVRNTNRNSHHQADDAAGPRIDVAARRANI